MVRRFSYFLLFNFSRYPASALSVNYLSSLPLRYALSDVVRRKIRKRTRSDDARGRHAKS